MIGLVLPKIGLITVQLRADRLAETAVLAERLGYESLWVGEHVVTPVSFGDEAYPGAKLPFAADSDFLEPFVALTHMAALTSTIRLGTNIVIAPLRDPFLTARAVASLDVLSGGRVEFGVGVGWMREEFEVMGQDFSTRGRRTDEFLAVVDLLFREPTPEFHGRFFDFGRVAFEPKPVQRPRPPVVVGGHSDAALRRAARYGDGWLAGTAIGVDKLPERLAFLREELRRAGREHERFEVSLLAMGPVPREELEAAAALGVHRWLVTAWGARGEPVQPGAATSVEAIEEYATSIGLTPVAAAT
jgi:probable F420-dependent oxidoreductase